MDVRLFEHIGWVVRSIEDALHFFNLSGYVQVSDLTKDTARKIYIIFIKKETSIIELIEPYDTNSVIYSYLMKHGPGPYHICFDKNKSKEFYNTIEKLNFIQITENEEASAFGGRCVQFFYNKKIGMIEFVS